MKLSLKMLSPLTKLLLCVLLFESSMESWAQLKPPMELHRLAKIPLYRDTKKSDFAFKQFGLDMDGQMFVMGKTVKPTKLGGIDFPAGTVIEGAGSLIRLNFDQPVTVNGVRICNEMGIHSDTLEVFEVKLCEDLKLAEGVIPAGSVIDFPKGMPKNGIKFSDIRCLLPAKATSLKGRPVKSGVEITPNYEVWEKPDRNCMRGGD